jgi:hypothetical protein
MRGTRAKSIRRYVRDNFPMLSDATLHYVKPDGTTWCHPSCKRALIQQIKNNYKKQQKGVAF